MPWIGEYAMQDWQQHVSDITDCSLLTSLNNIMLVLVQHIYSAPPPGLLSEVCPPRTLKSDVCNLPC